MRFNRLDNKHFAELAENNGIFGSAQLSDNNQGVITSDYNQIPSLQAFKEGWNSATLTSKRLPPLEEFQGLESYLSYLINYLYQEGTALWNSNQAYFKGSFCKTLDNDKPILWYSKTDNNVNNEPAVPSDYWQMVDFSLFANTDLSNLTATGEAHFANSNASNFSQAGKSYLSGLGYPSDSYIDVTVLASDSNYTAPANGWFNTRWHQTGSTVHYIQFRNENNTQLRAIQYYSTVVGDTAAISTFVRKDEKIMFRYDGIPSTECEYFRFYYAEGETNV